MAKKESVCLPATADEVPDYPERVSPEQQFASRSDLSEGISGRQGINTLYDNTEASRHAVMSPRSARSDEDAPDSVGNWDEYHERRQEARDWQDGDEDRVHRYTRGRRY